MLDYFVTLPLVARIIGLLTVAVLAAWGWLKRKAIAAFTGALSNAASKRFWEYLRKKMGAGAPNVGLCMVVGIPARCQWYIGARADTPVMTVQFPMSFAHNARGLSIIIKRAYLEETQEAGPTIPIVVDGPYCPETMIFMSLLPITVKLGENLKGKVVFVDQFNHKHVTEEKVTFTPHRLPIESRGSQPLTCFFCRKTIELGDIAHESYMPAHIRCIWK
jgi:hypothetical protein